MTARTSVSATLCTLLVAACGPSGDSSGTAGSGPSAGTGASDAPVVGIAGTQPAPPAARVDAARLVAADAEPGQWMSTGRTYREQRYSPLAEITPDNVAELGLAWYADLGINRTQEATPLYIDGTLYVTTAWSNVQAYDARTGERLWAFDAQVPREWGSRACCDVVNRGAAAWNGKIYVGTIDGRLVAIDAASGEKVWETDTLVSRDVAYTITGAPRVVKGRVIIGNGGAEYGVRGYVSAYDAETGELVWRFFTVPGDPALGFENETMAMAAETWNGEWWRLGGGGTVWDSMAYDPELDLLYIGTGNGSPWNQALRSPGGGDNLFLSSIVALDPDDGSYVWHYQTTPGETWDYTATQPIVVADLTIDGVERRVVMQAPKNGFFYVLDAKTGELISANNFAAVNWATGIDPETGRPIENPAARYDRTGRPVAVQPSSAGAHNWHPMAFSPQTGFAYFSASDNALIYAPARNFDPNPRVSNLGIDLAARSAEATAELARLPRGAYVLAWDPVGQREAWRAQGDSAGMLATAGGLVFHGTGDGLVARSAQDGTQLWSSESVHTGIVAGPISFEVDGEQHIAVVAGRAAGNYYAPSHARLLVWKRGGTAELPPPVEFSPPPLNPPPSTASADEIARGQQLYQSTCWICHENPGNAGGMFRRGLFPDLAYSPALASPELFAAIVLGGARAANGMVSFADVLDADEAEAIRAYIVDRANAVRPPDTP
ncbi:MAG TPA: PQQ-dependent dehydrogenase, methanol/ethanol family [Gammaproteobacteria bacterium]